MQQTRGRGTAALASAVVAAALLLFLISRVGPWSRSSSQPNGIGPSVFDLRAEDGLATVERTPREGVESEVVGSSTIEGDAVSSLPSDEFAKETEIEKKVDQFRLAMESSLLGVLDAGAFLDTALLLTELEVASNAIPESDPSGALRYPVLGTPEGIQAELRIGQTSNPNFASPTLGLKIHVDLPNSPYLLEGALRQEAEATMQIWIDPNGKIKHLGILTDFQPAPDGRDLMLSQGSIPLTAHYSLDLESLTWTSTSSLLKDGSLQDQALPVTFLGRTCPQLGELEKLSSGLTEMYESLKSN